MLNLIQETCWCSSGPLLLILLACLAIPGYWRLIEPGLSCTSQWRGELLWPLAHIWACLFDLWQLLLIAVVHLTWLFRPSAWIQWLVGRSNGYSGILFLGGGGHGAVFIHPCRLAWWKVINKDDLLKRHDIINASECCKQVNILRSNFLDRNQLLVRFLTLHLLEYFFTARSNLSSCDSSHMSLQVFLSKTS